MAKYTVTKKDRKKYTVSDKALAQRRKNVALMPAETPEEKSYNARQIEHIMKIHEIAATADRNDLLSLKSCFVAYLKLCQEDGFKISNINAYCAMGMTREQFFFFKKREDPEARAFAEMVTSTCAMAREMLIADNKLNPVIGIFWQRNFDGLRNDTEQVQAIQEQMDNDMQSGSAYKDKYRNVIDE